MPQLYRPREPPFACAHWVQHLAWLLFEFPIHPKVGLSGHAVPCASRRPRCSPRLELTTVARPKSSGAMPGVASASGRVACERAWSGGRDHSGPSLSSASLPRTLSGHQGDGLASGYGVSRLCGVLCAGTRGAARCGAVAPWPPLLRVRVHRVLASAGVESAPPLPLEGHARQLRGRDLPRNAQAPCWQSFSSLHLSLEVFA